MRFSSPAALVPLALSILVLGRAHGAEGFLAQPALHGNRLVFVSEGDLWIASIPEDTSARMAAHRLTHGAGVESAPIFSPDGTSVAFSAEYEGNRDVYVMPLDGGAPVRLTYHPDPDQPIAWTPDGKRVAVRSPRQSPLGRNELFFVNAEGGPAEPAGFGECSMIAFDPTSDGSKFAFTRWSNEAWNWRRYRGGTAPEIWLGDRTAQTFRNLTSHVSNDLFPMWTGDRIAFVSDRDGTTNLWSMRADGTDLQQHTNFVDDASKPLDPAGFAIRSASIDAGGRPIVAFAQAGGVALADLSTGGDASVRRLAIDLIGDRVGTRPRFVDALKNASAFSLSPLGDRLLLESRGELLTVPVGKPSKGVQIGPRQITRESASREWGAVWLSEKEIACITDAGGEQQIATLAADGSGVPTLATSDRAQWLLRPVASPDGRFIAFGDKDLRLWLMDVATRTLTEVDRSAVDEIIDYSFSSDGSWLAWQKQVLPGFNAISLRSTQVGTRIDLSDGVTNDREPRFDPHGKYLWFLSDRHIDPLIAGPDFEFVLPAMTQLCAVSLLAETPPPSPTLAAAAGFDLEAWSKSTSEEESKDAKETEDAGADNNAEDEEGEDEPLVIHADGIRERIWRLPVEPGNYRDLVATHGGVWFVSDPTRGIAEVEWPAPALGEAIGTLRRFTALDGETKNVVEGIASFAANKDGSIVAWMKDGAFVVRGADEKEEPVQATSLQVRVDPPAEWRQMLDETWRLQRDFFWAPNMAGVNWDAMRERYRSLLPRIGTRSEAGDLMGQLIGELGTSHTYIMGGDDPDRAKPVSVGLLGASLVPDGNVVRIDSILPGRPGDADLVSPLALPHLGIKPGAVLFSIDGRTVRADRDPYELLLDTAGRSVVLELADDAQGNNRRTIEVLTIPSERPLQYAAWVDANRREVDRRSEGRLGYVHIIDMDVAGLTEFSRSFFPQTKKDGLVVDIRDNGGGWVSQLILDRIARTPWAYQVPRQGAMASYPQRLVDGPKVILIDQNAGSDGDIFPESIRMNRIAPLIGTRTWGGVVGIRGDKPYLDLGLSTQPEFAWWDPTKDGVGGWSVENVGVAPDIEIDLTPGDRAAGQDPQLAKGIEVLLEELANNPRRRPTVPSFPDRSRIAP